MLVLVVPSNLQLDYQLTLDHLQMILLLGQHLFHTLRERDMKMFTMFIVLRNLKIILQESKMVFTT